MWVNGDDGECIHFDSYKYRWPMNEFLFSWIYDNTFVFKKECPKNAS